MRGLLSIFLVLILSSYGIVKHKKYNYYKLNGKSIVSEFLILEKMDTIQKKLELKCTKRIAHNSKEIFFSIYFSPLPLLDTNLVKGSYNWKHMDKVFPIDTITHISLRFSTKKNDTLNIPYKFVNADNCNSLSVNHYKEMQSYTISPILLIDDFNDFATKYNSRNILISYENIHRHTVLCELDLSNINFEDLNKDKLVADFIIEFTNGRKLVIKQTISIALK